MAFIDPNDFEQVALDEASKLAGAYLYEQKMHEVVPNDWQPEQWTTLIGVIVSAYLQSLQDQGDQALSALRKATILPPVGAERFPSFNTGGHELE